MKVKLYEPFMKWYHGGTIWLYGDPHFQEDTEMEKYFRWPTSEERLARINKCVTKNDTFICLGDVGDRLDLVSKIKCDYKVLITGNHDAGVENYKRVKDFHITYALTKEEAKEIITNRTYYAGGMIQHQIEDKWVDLKISTDIARDFERALYKNGDENRPDARWEIYADNHLFDEIYKGPLFISDKILLSHEKIETPYALNIHGHHHTQPYASQALFDFKDARGDIQTYSAFSINLAADCIDFIPKRLDEILKDYPLSKINNIHDITRKLREGV